MNELTLQQRNPLSSADPAAIAAAEAAKARIQSAYIMAMHRPRNEDQARDRILSACKRPMFAERVEYSKPVSGRAIKGPSIRFAELALREWQNVLTETQTVYEDDAIRRIKVIVTDLETNATHSKDIQVIKTVERKKTEGREVVGERTNTNGEKVWIVKATDDELHNKEAALISKALRNEGLRLIPSDIVDEAIDVARDTLKNQDAQDPAAAKKKLLDAFSEIGIKPKDLEQYLKHKTDLITPAELQDLRGMYRAIRDGEARWSDYLEPTPTEQKTEEKKEELKEKIRHRRTKAEMEAAKTQAEEPPTPKQPATSDMSDADYIEHINGFQDSALLRDWATDNKDLLAEAPAIKRAFVERFDYLVGVETEASRND